MGLLLPLAAALVPLPLVAQHAPELDLSAHGVLVHTHVAPIPGGGSLGELRLVHPVVMGRVHALGGVLRAVGTLNLEGLTAPGGELTPGAFGEGFVDRRHPHTYIHELLVAAVWPPAGDVRASLTVGKGFAPFGTDDPMTRPIHRYPVNHHFSQILERWVAIAAVRTDLVALEVGLFNGDEPAEPDDWPALDRFGDSWSGRLTVYPARGLELHGSYADVHSPEHREGAGPDHSKWNLAAQVHGPVGRIPVDALIEWSRTSEGDGTFVFESILLEGAWTRGAHRLSYRFERTERPEEERLLDPFRSARPHLDNSILGTTRWTVHTVAYQFRLASGRQGVAVAPFGEVSRARASRVSGAGFDPEAFYGGGTIWSLSLGVRVGLGGPMHRMGRYGAMAAEAGAGFDGKHTSNGRN